MLRRSLRRTGLLADLGRIAILGVASLVLAAAVDGLHPAGLPLWPPPQMAAGVPRRVWPHLKFADAESLATAARNGAVIVDVRDPRAYAAGHPSGAVNLPYRQLPDYLPDFLARTPRSKPLLLYCYGHACTTSLRVANRLVQEGFGDVTTVRGGFEAWHEREMHPAGGG